MRLSQSVRKALKEAYAKELEEIKRLNREWQDACRRAANATSCLKCEQARFDVEFFYQAEQERLLGLISQIVCELYEEEGSLD